MNSYLSSISKSRPDRMPSMNESDEKQFETLIKTSFTSTRIDAYTLIMERNRKISHIGYINRGTVDLLSKTPGGHTCRKGILGQGDFFGLEYFFDQGLSLYDALSLEPLECYIIEPYRLSELLQEKPAFRVYLEGILLDNMRRFLRNSVIREEEEQAKTVDPKMTRFERTLSYIDSHYMNPLTLDDVARKAGLSRFYFSRMFKKETGHSFKDYLNINRMTAAKKMLRMPDMNISQACYSVGFNDVSYFARIFKRYEGISPSEFRKKRLYGE